MERSNRILKSWKFWNDAQVEFQAPIRAGNQGVEVAFDLTTATFNWREALLRLARAALVTVLLAFGAMVIAVVFGMPLALGNGKVLIGSSIVHRVYRILSRHACTRPTAVSLFRFAGVWNHYAGVANSSGGTRLELRGL